MSHRKRRQELAKAARKVAVEQDLPSFDGVAQEILREPERQRQQLKRLSEAVNIGDAYGAYAHEIGKGLNDLTIVEKRQAVFNAVLVGPVKEVTCDTA